MSGLQVIVYPPPQHIVRWPRTFLYEQLAADFSSLAPPIPTQPSGVIQSPILGPVYTVIDADGNRIALANGQPIVSRTPVPHIPTAQLIISGGSIRLTQANAANWPYSAGQSFIDADGHIVTFASASPVYSGGIWEAPNTGGVRMQFKGLFCSLTAANLTTLGTPLAVFAATGIIS